MTTTLDLATTKASLIRIAELLVPSEDGRTMDLPSAATARQEVKALADGLGAFNRYWELVPPDMAPEDALAMRGEPVEIWQIDTTEGKSLYFTCPQREDAPPFSLIAQRFSAVVKSSLDVNQGVARHLQCFPDYGELDFEVPTGFADLSSKNDAMPLFEQQLTPTRYLQLWTDYADQSKSEIHGSRFTLCLCDDIEGFNRTLISSDDFDEVTSFLGASVTKGGLVANAGVETALAKKHLDSAEKAEKIAGEKGEFGVADLSADRPIMGRVLGVTDGHVVLSLGRSATILEKSDLSRVPAKGEDVSIAVKGGKAIVADLRANKIDRGR